jgi:hypothetical protein
MESSLWKEKGPRPTRPLSFAWRSKPSTGEFPKAAAVELPSAGMANLQQSRGDYYRFRPDVLCSLRLSHFRRIRQKLTGEPAELQVGEVLGDQASR